MTDRNYLFYRVATDGRVMDCSFLENSYGGTGPASVWLIGGGPSLKSAPLETIKDSPAPVFGVNLAGRDKDGEPPLIRPDLWTCFDPSERFHRSIYLDPSIQKFMLGGRTLDLVPGGTEKVCDCPNTYFINHETRGYLDAFGQQHQKILHSLDAFMQAIDICFRLGFRRIYCVGCDMRIRPSEAQVQFAESVGVTYDREKGWTIWEQDSKTHQSDRLSDFRDRVQISGKFKSKTDASLALEKVERESQYSFGDPKRFLAACACDNHYWDRVQYLRLSRKNMSLNGLELISCTPDSRLNLFFPYVSPFDAAKRITSEVGSWESESSMEAYGGERERRNDLPFHRDIDPYGWKKQAEKKIEENIQQVPIPPRADRRDEIASQLALMKRDIQINEEG